MLQGEMVQMMVWKEHFCEEDAAQPVNMVKTNHYGGGISLDGSMFTQRCRSWDDRGGTSQWSWASTGQPSPLAGIKE